MRFGVCEPGEEVERVIEAASLEEARRILGDEELAIVPLCPNCGVALTTVSFEEAGYLDVNEDGSYCDGGQTSGRYVCGACGETIGGYGQQTWGFIPELE